MTLHIDPNASRFTLPREQELVDEHRARNPKIETLLSIMAQLRTDADATGAKVTPNFNFRGNVYKCVKLPQPSRGEPEWAAISA